MAGAGFHRRIRHLLTLTIVIGLLFAQPATAASGGADPPTTALTNLSHLNFLRETVKPPEQVGHTTYQLENQPQLGVLWTYAEPQPDGSWRRLGGGTYNQTSGHYGQGAFNADDIARASVVYLRHWRTTGDPNSRAAAYQLLRGLTYLQTSTGPNAGNVVLWMQPDGTLNSLADPPDSPAPSDSADSYWLARTIWALGEGYAAFQHADLGFAGFLRDRMSLALDAVGRQPLGRYGQWHNIDGIRSPAWLIAQGADATGEALLGLSAYVATSGDPRAMRICTQLTEAVTAMGGGEDPNQWPYGAVLPWGLSRSIWHAWGGLAPAGLAAASTVVAQPLASRARSVAVADATSFTPHLLVASGADNAWSPAPVDTTQISYGVQSRVESLLRVAESSSAPGAAALAGVAAAWFFGVNRAGRPMYDPATGRTFDGISANGTVNQHSGAESTIHGLLTTLALDTHPQLQPLARGAAITGRSTTRIVEAESGLLGAQATVYQPTQPWTGESQWSGGAGVRLAPGASLSLNLTGGSDQKLRLMPVVNLEPGAGSSNWWFGSQRMGTVDQGLVGVQGDSPAPGMLTIRTLPGVGTVTATGASTTVTVTATGGTVLLDALLVQPLVEWLALSTVDGHAGVLVRSFAAMSTTTRVPLPGPVSQPATVVVYSPTGQRLSVRRATMGSAEITIPSGGFALASRP